MSTDTHNKGRLIPTINPIIPRLLIIIFSIALFSIAGAVGTAVYKKVPVEIWGMKIGYQMEETKTGDIPFLLTEVQQLKEQRKLLEKRLFNLTNDNEVQKNQLKECENKINLKSKG